MDLVPSIDLRGGRVVRLRRGDDAQRTFYDVDPRQTLLAYAEAGARLVHLVDLDAAFGEEPQRSLIESLVSDPDAPAVELGGGLRDRESVEWAFGSGLDRVVITSMMVRDFDLFGRIVETFPDRVVAAFDIDRDRLKLAGWTEAATLGWKEIAVRMRTLPIAAVLVTDIQRDGTRMGPNFELAREVAVTSSSVGLLSGGVRSLDDLRAARRIPELAGTIVGKALYDGAFTVAEALAACRG